ncbi:hypothetical protein GGS20DRAFT_560671 [Poronia punctata]|nr:hypothetical protein GGS20DRAFT_560671 [Poronia punctata]
MASSASTPTIPPPSSSPPQQPELQTKSSSPPLDQFNNANPMIHKIALGVTPLALLGLCLPPRRLDLRAMLLGGVALWGTNQLTHDYTGRSFSQRFSARAAQLSGTELPEKAKEIQIRLREDKERRARLQALRDEMVRTGALKIEVRDGVEIWTEEQKRTLREAYEKERDRTAGVDADGKDKNVLEKIWMGDATPDWKEKRAQREREALQDGGGGYWGLIADQISEVFGFEKKSEDDVTKGKTSEDVKKS